MAISDTKKNISFPLPACHKLLLCTRKDRIRIRQKKARMTLRIKIIISLLTILCQMNIIINLNNIFFYIIKIEILP
ncbi:hypothetical protein CDIMF43_220245 [Carnobacterium divergens]|nr:hypothetical protein CDIMF43_220245 [Carnobacterium divergens]